jgi:hypothetical protein
MLQENWSKKYAFGAKFTRPESSGDHFFAIFGSGKVI